MTTIQAMLVRRLVRKALTNVVRQLGVTILTIMLPGYLSGQEPSLVDSLEVEKSSTARELLWGEELRSARTFNSKTYVSADGFNFTTMVSGGYLHYKDEAGEFEEIDHRIKLSPDSTRYEVKKGLYRAAFALDLKSAGFPVRFEMRDGTTFRVQPTALGYFDRASKRLVILEAAISSQGVATANRIRYPELFSGIDVEYE